MVVTRFLNEKLISVEARLKFPRKQSSFLRGLRKEGTLFHVSRLKYRHFYCEVLVEHDFSSCTMLDDLGNIRKFNSLPQFSQGLAELGVL